MPILDYHCHLSPKEIWENQPYGSITQAWLGADHYKWRLMRSNGIPEEKITGNTSEREKFFAWAETLPYCIGNPLYHWTHLELQRYFGIDEPLCANSAARIWEQCNQKLATKGFLPRELVKRSRVELICTTDDPADSLEYHQKIQADPTIGFEVLPCFRPDAALYIEREGFLPWLQRLEAQTNQNIETWPALQHSLSKRMDFFARHGCKLSDHGMDEVCFAEASDAQVQAIFQKRLENRLGGQRLNDQEIAQYKSALWIFLGQEYSRRGWAMQLHIGALRNNNQRMRHQLGPDTGFDSIDDLPIARPLSRFLDALERQKLLPKTILYNVHAAGNDVLAAMIGNFQDGSLPGKLQFGSAWWFADHRDGIEAQLRSLANLGLLSRFVGMLTDSRSFLSYPRHEYFRRILCNLLGGWVENGEYPCDEAVLGQIVQDICYHNAKRYFDF